MVEGVCTIASIIGTLVLLVAIAVAVFIHEMGHYLVARKFGIVAKEFAIGFGTKLFSFNKGGTEFSIRLIPMGGYCKFDDDNDNVVMFPGLAYWKKMLILVAGVTMNFIFAFIVLTGIAFSQIEDKPIIERTVVSIQASAHIMGDVATGIFDFSSKEAAEATGTAETIEKPAKTFGDYWLEFWVQIFAINLILGIFNILPIPVLDGGRMLINGVEWVSGKPVPEKVAVVYYGIGIIIVAVLFIVQFFV